MKRVGIVWISFGSLLGSEGLHLSVSCRWDGSDFD
jgi:hypothetical protein